MSIITGLFRGFVKELIALIVWFVAIWLAYNYANHFDEFLSSYIHDSRIRTLSSFILILIGTLLFGAVFNAILSFILKRSGLSGTDRLLGMGFGFVRGVFIVSLMMLMVRMANISHTEYSKQSQLYTRFYPIVNWMHQQVPNFVGHVQQYEHQLSIESKPQNKREHALTQDEKLVMNYHEQNLIAIEG